MKDYNGWKDLQTRQSKEILSELVEAKEQQKALLLIANTGLGKTNSIKIFVSKMQKHTWCITVGDSYKLIDVVDAILDAMGIEYREIKHAFVKRKLELITSYLKELQSNNNTPMIILDEAENLKPSVLKMIKELYDAVHEYSSIVLIGTEQILDSILNRKHKNRQSVPQLWRRFKAGTRYISILNKAKDFKPFFDMYLPGETGLQGLLISLCENYGELHDYLDPALRYSAKTNKPLTEEMFRLLHKIPASK